MITKLPRTATGGAHRRHSPKVQFCPKLLPTLARDSVQLGAQVSILASNTSAPRVLKLDVNSPGPNNSNKLQTQWEDSMGRTRCGGPDTQSSCATESVLTPGTTSESKPCLRPKLRRDHPAITNTGAREKLVHSPQGILMSNNANDVRTLKECLADWRAVIFNDPQFQSGLHSPTPANC